MLAIARWFMDSHSDKFREIIFPVAAPTTRTWTVNCESSYNTPELYEYEEGSADLFASWMECVRDFPWHYGQGSDNISSEGDVHI